MAVPENDTVPNEGSDARFVEQSHLSYAIPYETDLSLEEAFKSVDLSRPLLDSIPRRKSLFFGILSRCPRTTSMRQRNEAHNT